MMIGQIDPKYIRTRPLKLWSRFLSYSLFEGRPLTTKGRWINRLVFAHLALEKRLPRLRKVEKPIFIIGAGRSGTTILGIVLSMHRDVGFLNEPKALWHSVLPTEDLIGSYGRGTAHYRLGADDATEGVIRNAHRLFGAYLFATGTQRVVDKYPEMIFRVPFLQRIFPDAKFLLLVRNGWDTCSSIDIWSKRFGTFRNGEVHNWWGINNRKWNLLVSDLIPGSEALNALTDEIRTMTKHTDMAAVEWILTMEEGMKLRNDFPDDVLMVYYEVLTSSSEETMTKITNFCELPEDGTFLKFSRQILSPAPPKPRLQLVPAIEPAFRKTMNQLGYLSE